MKLEERCSCGAEFRVEADGYRELQTFTSSTRESLPDLAIGLGRLDAWQARHQLCGEAGSNEINGRTAPSSETFEEAAKRLDADAFGRAIAERTDREMLAGLPEAERQKALLERERDHQQEHETLHERLARIDRQKAKPR